MRIVCPSCATAYEVPASRLTPRKMVRCAQCGSEWMAMQEAEEPAPPVEEVDPRTPPPPEPRFAAPAVTAMDRLAAGAPPPRRSGGLIGAWIATLMILAAAVTATIVWREDVMRAWPPSSRILSSVDRPAPEHGIGPASTASQR